MFIGSAGNGKGVPAFNESYSQSIGKGCDVAAPC